MNPLNKIQQLIKVTLVIASLLMAPIAAIAAEMVDINRADAATMIENWKGIGEKKARAIVSYRKKNGKFSSIEDLANVTGIGEGLIKNNRKYMSVSKGAFKPSGKTAAKTTTSSKTDKSAKSKTKETKDSKSKASKSKDSKTTKAKKESSKTTKKDSKSKKKSTTKTKKKECTSKSKDKNCKKKTTKKKAKTS